MEISPSKNFANAWQEIFAGLTKLMNDGVSATSDATKPFATKARDMINLFTGGDQGIKQSLDNMYAKEGGAQMLRNHGLDVSDALFDYYEQALQKHASAK